jgi:Flp pilus assembly protein TadG
MMGSRERRRTTWGQGLAEMALVLPAFLALLMGCIDVGRYVYIAGQITMNTATAARLASMTDNQSTDCPSLTAAEQSGGGFTISQDPLSIAGDSGTPTAASSITAGSGYVYVYPAVATDNAGTCAGSARTGVGTPKSVTVTTTFKFRTLTPYMSTFLGNMVITANSTNPTGY